MTDVNLVIVSGRMVGDPELNYPAGNVPVVTFTLATKKQFVRPVDGSRETRTVLVDVSAWRRTAEICAQFLRKGRSILVVGELRQEREIGRGEEHGRIHIDASTVQFLNTSAQADPEAEVRS